MPNGVECSDAPLVRTDDRIDDHVTGPTGSSSRRAHEHWVTTRMSADETLPAEHAAARPQRAALSMGTHWLSASMGAAPTPGPWTARAEPPAVEALPVVEVSPLDQIATLEEKLKIIVAATTAPRSETASPVLYEPPPFLGDADEAPAGASQRNAQPNLPALIPVPAPDPVSTISHNLGWGMAAAACALAVLAGGIGHTTRTTGGSAACTDPSCETTAPTMSNLMARASLAGSAAPAVALAPGLAVASAPPAVGPLPEPAFDPVETITVRGVAPEVKLSAGQKISDTDWSLAPNELSNVSFVVPHDRADPVRAEIEIKSRQGIVLARLGLGIVNEPPPPPAEIAAVKEVIESPATCLGEPCGNLSPSMYAIASNLEILREDHTQPGIVLADEAEAAGEAPEPPVEQADSVTVSGLPPNVELSAGERISETGWKIASAELADVGVVIPHDQVEPVRADIEFKSNDGLVMARLGLDIVHAQPPPAAEVATEPEAPAIRPPPRAKKGRAAAVKAQPAYAAPAPRKLAAPAIQPRGLFQFEPPQKSAKPKPTQAPKAEAKKPEKKAEAPAAVTQASAAPVGSEQAPGFRIQSTLDRPN
ncbi:MAG: hypothetical protein K2Y42_01020 [Hyphomicrobium sp.]|jgi:hypothetical protein|uniref:hypothetical protein n=1 Tax=Hyphomicrobium sp. TaxID=82 RepID=UPI0025BAFC12|nr:hypothetical protein [Hyphomicrobium sp.]MBX9861306.1 hypothetical protein [Hyphomicrobium sp.]